MPKTLSRREQSELDPLDVENYDFDLDSYCQCSDLNEFAYDELSPRFVCNFCLEKIAREQKHMQQLQLQVQRDREQLPRRPKQGQSDSDIFNTFSSEPNTNRVAEYKPKKIDPSKSWSQIAATK